MSISDRTKLLALAHLKLGKKPREVEEMCDISYTQALKLKKDLDKASTKEKMLQLFSLEEAQLGQLLKMVEGEFEPLMEILDADLKEDVKAISKDVKNKANKTKELETELEEAAIDLVKNIRAHSYSLKTSESLNELADALSKLQKAFFDKGTSVNINQMHAENSFESYLKD